MVPPVRPCLIDLLHLGALFGTGPEEGSLLLSSLGSAQRLRCYYKHCFKGLEVHMLLFFPDRKKTMDALDILEGRKHHLKVSDPICLVSGY